MSSHIRQLGGTLAVLACFLLPSAPAAADQLLQNGGFEAGSQGWLGTGTNPDDCAPASGSLAMGLSTSSTQPLSRLSQDVPQSAPGSYTISGKARIVSGSPQIDVSLLWLDASGGTISTRTFALNPVGAYTSFSFNDTAPGATRALALRISSRLQGSSRLCLDDLALEGPPPAPLATATATSSPTATATATPSLTPTMAASATATRVPPSQTAVPTSTTAAAAPTQAPDSQPGLSFINGGFESGLSGWQKFGGELRSVGNPSRSGSAGALSSSTDSTKWAFQVVAIDATQAYQFSGHLRADSSVSAAYLRVSWYTSADGSGQAIATSDSTSRIDGGSSDFVYLSTGAVAPPAGARSARLRAVMTPSSASTATLYLDDFAFSTATLSAASTPVPAAAAIAPISDALPATEPPPPPAVAASSTPPPSTATARAQASVVASTRTPLAGAPVLEARLQPTPRSEAQGIRSEDAKPSGGGLPVWPLAALAGLSCLGGVYLYARHRQP